MNYDPKEYNYYIENVSLHPTVWGVGGGVYNTCVHSIYNIAACTQGKKSQLLCGFVLPHLVCYSNMLKFVFTNMSCMCLGKHKTLSVGSKCFFFFCACGVCLCIVFSYDDHFLW